MKIETLSDVEFHFHDNEKTEWEPLYDYFMIPIEIDFQNKEWLQKYQKVGSIQSMCKGQIGSIRGIRKTDDKEKDVIYEILQWSYLHGTLTNLDLNACKTLHSLNGLENFVNLKRLEIIGIDVTSLKKLSNLTKLNDLRVGPCKARIESIDGLSNLTNMQVLWIYSCMNVDFNIISKMYNLTDLRLRGSIVYNVGMISCLTNLTLLEIGSRIDMEDNITFTKLTKLFLHFYGITPTASISNLTNLTSLKLLGRETPNLNGFSRLTKLKELVLSENYILQNVSQISHLTNLTKLHIDIGSFQVNFLECLTNCTELTLTSTTLDTLRPLSKMTKLKELNLNNCRNLTSIDGIGPNMSYLTKLYLKDCTKLTNLDDLLAIPKLHIGMPVNHQLTGYIGKRFTGASFVDTDTANFYRNWSEKRCKKSKIV